MSAKKSTLPRCRTDQEERTFWAEHSVEELGAELEELDVAIRPARTEQIVLRLYHEDLEALREVARKKGVGHTTLARSILEQWLARVREKLAAPARRTRPPT